ncbi:MAG: outer membrane protein transport protein, partial [Pseudomonadales bacterium]|nr:outer membrane protein transport protein [Pseudomonadales bacterium]
MKGNVIRLALMLTMGLYGYSVSAQNLENIETGSARAFALANAVTADPPGIDSIHFNPAGLSRLPDVGRLIEYHLIVAAADVGLEKGKANYEEVLNSDINFDDCDNECLLGGTYEDPAGDYDIRPSRLLVPIPKYGLVKFDQSDGFTPVAYPRAGVAIRSPGSKFTFANSFYPEIMGGIAFDTSDRGEYGGLNHLAATFFNYFTPTVAYQINNEWSVGLGMGFIGNRWDADAYIRLPHPLVGALGKAFQQVCSGDEDILDFCSEIDSEDNPLDPWKSLVRLEGVLE